MKKLLALGLVIVAGVLIWVGTIGSPAPSAQPSAAATAPTVLPVTSNPIKNTGTKTGITISNARAENNTDPQTKAPVADRLQFTLTNTSTAPVTGLEVYYTMKDSTTGQTESYYQKLNGLTLAPSQNTTIYFDNGTGAGHYPENKYSLYRTSTDQIQISVEAAAPGLAPVNATATKAKGAGEKID